MGVRPNRWIKVRLSSLKEVMKEKPTLPPVEDLVKDVLQEIRGRKKSTKQKGIDK